MKLPQLTLADKLAGAVAVIVAAIMLGLYAAGLLNIFERQTIDQRFSIRGARSPGSSIVIIGIDPHTIETLDKPPLPRSDYARILDRVRAGSPRVIGIDIEFGRPSPNPADDRELLAAIARDGPVLLTTHEGNEGPISVPAHAPDTPKAVRATAGVDQDRDGVVRRMMYVAVIGGLETFAVRAAELYNNQPVNEADFPLNHAWIDFRGPPGTFPHYSFADVLNGTIPTDTFRGKAVLIGVTDPLAAAANRDLFTTPISPVPMSGVEVQANALSTVLNGLRLRSAGGPLNAALIVALIAIPAAIGARKPALFTLAGSIGLGALFLIGAQLAFNAGWIVVLTYPIAGLAITTAGIIAVDSYTARRKRANLEHDVPDVPPKGHPNLFISYRREQSDWQANALRNELEACYGDNTVFIDIKSIDYGEPVPNRIDNAIEYCTVMFVLIGPRWLQRVDGTRRIDEPNDWVRQEIQLGLQLEKRVIPVLHDGAKMPKEDELPDSIKGLAALLAIEITAGDLAADIESLRKAIKAAPSRRTNERDSPSPAPTAGGG